jgi:hypothetical protein
MEIFPGADGRTLRMLQEQQDVAAAIIPRRLLGTVAGSSIRFGMVRELAAVL